MKVGLGFVLQLDAVRNVEFHIIFESKIDMEDLYLINLEFYL